MMSIRGKVKKLMSENKELSKEVCFLYSMELQYNREYKVYENIDKKQNELLNNVFPVVSPYYVVKEETKRSRRNNTTIRKF